VKPLISILIPYYNADIYFIDALESIKSQTYENYEIVIIDDGSERPLSDFLTTIDMSCITTLIRNDTNLGITKSLNKGIEHCHGKFIARFDADDIMFPNRLELQYEQMISTLSDVVLGQIESFPVRMDYTYPLTNDAIRNGLYFGNTLPHPGTLIKSSILKKFKYLEVPGCKGLEDYYLWIRLANSGVNFSGISQKVIKYRLSSNQLTSQQTTLNCKQAAFKYLQSIIKFNHGFSIKENVFKNILLIMNKKGYINKKSLLIIYISYLKSELRSCKKIQIDNFILIVAIFFSKFFLLMSSLVIQINRLKHA
jgi:glycosyltransferase involved in cell wall biosynthesis